MSLSDAGLQTCAPSACALVRGAVCGTEAVFIVFYAGRSPRAPSAYALVRGVICGNGDGYDGIILNGLRVNPLVGESVLDRKLIIKNPEKKRKENCLQTTGLFPLRFLSGRFVIWRHKRGRLLRRLCTKRYGLTTGLLFVVSPLCAI